MSHPTCPDPAFVGTTALNFPSSLNSTRSLSSSRPRPSSHCNNRPIRNWRCTVTDEGVGDATNHTGIPSDGSGHVNSQTEGRISDLELTTLDDGLDDALSKSWDILQGFEAGMELPLVYVNEEEEKKGVDVKEGAAAVTDESPVEGNIRLAQEGGDSHSNSVKEQEMPTALRTDEPVQVLESDSAVEAIEDAKKGKKARKKMTTANSTKAKSTAKKRAKKVAVEGTEGSERELTKREILDSETWDPEPHWYFLQVKPGCEQSCAISIRNMARSLEKLEVHEVLVPATTILRLTKGGQSRKKEERIFPGYILVRMVMNYQNYNDLQKIPNVQYFMGDPNRDKGPNDPFRPPIPVSDAEMKVVYEKVSAADNQDPEKKTMLRPGDSVEVLRGNFKGSKGHVNEVKPHSNIVTVKLLMFGREKPVELELDQVAPIPDNMNIPQPEQGSQASSSASAETNKNIESGRMERSNEKRGAYSYDKGHSADVASAADDLAALLADVPGSSDDEFDDFFASTQDSTEFGGSGGRTRSWKSTGRSDSNGFLDFDNGKAADRSKTNPWLDEEHENHEFSGGKMDRADAPVSNDNEEDPFAFLDEDINAAEQASKGSKSNELRPRRELVEEDVPPDALIKSDEDLASFLSDSEEQNIWDTAEDFSSVHEAQNSPLESTFSEAKFNDSPNAELGDNVKQERMSNEFAFLDEFDEAEVLPDNAQASGLRNTGNIGDESTNES